MKKHLFMLAAALTAFAACDKESNGPESGDGASAENPNPTSIESLYLAKTEITADPNGFNMLTDGGFENFADDENWKSKSLYYMPDYVSEAETPLTGSRSLHAEVGFDGWGDVAVQSVCLKKNKSYTLSLWYQGAWKGLNCYMGFRGAAGHDVNTNNPEKNDVWEEYTYTYENTDDIKVDAFFGGWCWYDLWLELDDMKVIPTGSTNDSFMPANASVTATSLVNASYNEVTAAEKIVVWKEADGKIAGMLHNATVGENALHNAFLTAKSDMKVVTVATESATASALIPTAGITVNGTKYVHFYEYAGETTPGADDDAETFIPDWTASGSVVYSSTDGAAWTETSLEWPADSKFIRAAYVQNGEYVYMFGTPAGDQARMTYIARVKAADFGTLTAYEYWAGEEWVADAALSAGIMYGPTDCMSVVYNSSKYTYMMIYRSATTGALVYRDAGLPEGEWSGEKILLADPDADTQLYAPQVIAVSGNELQFVASKK